MNDFVQQYLPGVYELRFELLEAIGQTIIMVTSSAFIAFIIGLLLGVMSVVMGPKGLLENLWIYNIIDKSINLFRSIPFIILIAALIPLTRLISGTSIGTTGAIFPLVIGITPFFTRQVEAALSEVDKGLVEAAEVMGFSPFEIIIYVYLRESRASLVRATTITLVNLIGLSAISGVVGAGGLGNFAILRGFQRNRLDVVYVSIFLILILVLVIELIGKNLIKNIKSIY